MKLLRPAILILGAVLLGGAYNPANLGNGWYSNLPPVTEEALAPVLSCLVQAGAPANPVLFSDPVFDWGDGRTQTPTQIRWESGGGVFFKNDATWTYYSPAVAYVDVMQATRTRPTREQVQAVENCAAAAKSPAVIVQVANPLGKKQEEKWCVDHVGVPDCWQGNQGDQFLPKGEFRDSTGLYRKESGGFFVFGWSVWRRVG